MFGQKRIFTNGRFSSQAVFTIAEGQTKTIPGIFDDSFYEADSGEQVLQTDLPRLTCRIEDTEGITREMLCTINGGNYSVLQVQPDQGTGLAVITFAHE